MPTDWLGPLSGTQPCHAYSPKRIRPLQDFLDLAVAQTVYLRSHYLSIARIEGVHERAASVADHLTGLPPSIDEWNKMSVGERKRAFTKARKHAVSVIDSFAKQISMTDVELAKHWEILKTTGKASDKGKP